MRILWLCAFAPGVIAKAVGNKQNVFGGWIDGSLKALAGNKDVTMAVCYPQRDTESTVTGSVDGIFYYGVFSDNAEYSYDSQLTSTYEKIIEEYHPDVIHIWGVEFPYYYAMTEAANNKVPTLCSIQGLCGIIAKHYFANLPVDVIKSTTFRDFLKRDNLIHQQKTFVNRGEAEKRILENTKHVIGRTEWDRACTGILAKQADYHFCNEVLRDVFYENADSWRYEDCEKHSIFVSQASYPIKGLHHVIEALRILTDEYPDAVIYSTGVDPFRIPLYRINSYQKYIKKLITQYKLKDRVVFVGSLNADEMCRRYLKSNVFVSASSIENSSNAVGEAMTLGMPVIASYVGGTMDLLKDKEEGFLYQADAPYMLAHYLKKVFDEGPLAKERGHRAYMHARNTHDMETNTKRLLEIYFEVINGD